MHSVLAIVSLLLALAVVGLLVQKQPSARPMAVPVWPPASPNTEGTAQPPSSVRAQGQRAQQPYQQAIESPTQQPRAMPGGAQ